LKQERADLRNDPVGNLWVRGKQFVKPLAAWLWFGVALSPRVASSADVTFRVTPLGGGQAMQGNEFSATFADQPGGPSRTRKFLGWIETTVVVFATAVAVLFVSFLAVMISIA
jgi:hypothetical protein